MDRAGGLSLLALPLVRVGEVWGFAPSSFWEGAGVRVRSLPQRILLSTSCLPTTTLHQE